MRVRQDITSGSDSVGVRVVHCAPAGSQQHQCVCYYNLQTCRIESEILKIVVFYILISACHYF